MTSQFEVFLKYQHIFFSTRQIISVIFIDFRNHQTVMYKSK